MDDLDIDDVNQIIRGVFENVLGEVKSLENEKVGEWTDAIVHRCLDEMVKLKKPFKYIVTCIINQRDGAGLFSHSLCYFNNEADLLSSVSWDNDVLRSNVSIYAMALNWKTIFGRFLLQRINFQFTNEFLSSSNKDCLFHLIKSCCMWTAFQLFFMNIFYSFRCLWHFS